MSLIKEIYIRTLQTTAEQSKTMIALVPFDMQKPFISAEDPSQADHTANDQRELWMLLHSARQAQRDWRWWTQMTLSKLNRTLPLSKRSRGAALDNHLPIIFETKPKLSGRTKESISATGDCKIFKMEKRDCKTPTLPLKTSDTVMVSCYPVM